MKLKEKKQQAGDKTLRVLKAKAKVDLDAVEATLNGRFAGDKVAFGEFLADKVLDLLVYDAVHKVADDLKGSEIGAMIEKTAEEVRDKMSPRGLDPVSKFILVALLSALAFWMGSVIGSVYGDKIMHKVREGVCLKG